MPGKNMREFRIGLLERIAVNSGMSDWHPVLKLLLSLISLTFCTASARFELFMFVFMAMLWFLLTQAQIAGRLIGQMLMLPSVFILTGAVAIMLEVSMEPVGIWYLSAWQWYLCLTSQSLLKAAVVTSRAYAGLACLSLLCLTTPVHELLNILKRVGVPSAIIELMYLIYRFLFILLEYLVSMTVAAKGRLGYQNYRNSLRSMKMIGSTLLLVSFRKTSACYDGMLSRGYSGSISFWQQGKKIRKKHLGLTAGYLLLLLAVFFWKGN